MRVRKNKKPVSYVVASLALLVALAVGGSGQAAASEGVSKGHAFCKQSKQVAVDGLQLQEAGGRCLLTRPGTPALLSRKGGRRVIRTGKIVDTDTTYGDGVFQVASGRAYCKHGEQVVTGGLQIISVSGLFGGPARTSGGESAPYFKKPGGWSVAFGSDLGGGARHDFRVVAVCEKT